MSNEKRHKDQATRNIDFLRSFHPDGKFPDWSITVAFYSAVHIIEYVIFISEDLKYRGLPIELQHSDQLINACKKKNLPPPRGYNWDSCTHHTLRNLLVEHSFPAEINWCYRTLYKKSRDARYNCFIWKDFEVKFLIEVFNKIVKWVNDEWGLNLQDISEQKMGKETEKKR